MAATAKTSARIRNEWPKGCTVRKLTASETEARDKAVRAFKLRHGWRGRVRALPTCAADGKIVSWQISPLQGCDSCGQDRRIVASDGEIGICWLCQRDAQELAKYGRDDA